jgi:hypothetical protein
MWWRSIEDDFRSSDGKVLEPQDLWPTRFQIGYLSLRSVHDICLPPEEWLHQWRQCSKDTLPLLDHSTENFGTTTIKTPRPFML